MQLEWFKGRCKDLEKTILYQEKDLLFIMCVTF